MANICYMCRESGESIEHLFNDCRFYKQITSFLFSRLGTFVVDNAAKPSEEFHLRFVNTKRAQRYIVNWVFHNLKGEM
jgi:hypothetical protein